MGADDDHLARLAEIFRESEPPEESGSGLAWGIVFAAAAAVVCGLIYVAAWMLSGWVMG